MRFKATILLSGILILLGAYLYFIEFPGEKKAAEEQLRSGKLFSFGSEEITRVVIRGPRGEIDLEQFPEHPTSPWRIFNPVETVANQQLGQQLADLLTGIKTSRLVEAKPKDLIDFGLDPPQFTVIITLQRHNTEIIEVGAENLTGSDVYVRKGEGTSLYLVPAGIRTLLSKNLFEWRQRDVFPYSSFDINRMRLESEKGQLTLEQDEEGWSMRVLRPGQRQKEAIEFRGNGGEIANLLGSLVNLRGITFVDKGKEEKKQRLGSAIFKISIKVGKVEREALFYQDDEMPELIDVVTRFEFDPIFQMSKKELEAIEQPFNTYRDRRLVHLTFPEEIEDLEIRRSDEVFVLKKKEGQWWMEGKDDAPLQEVGMVSRLLTDLYNFNVQSFEDALDMDSTLSGLQNPRLTIIMKGKNQNALGEIRFGKIEGDRVYARSSAQAFPVSLDASVLERIPRGIDFSAKQSNPTELPGQ